MPLSPLFLPPLCSLGAQSRQVQLIWTQLQHFQWRGGSVPHRQKDPIIHHRPLIWSSVHVSVIKLFLHHQSSSDLSLCLMPVFVFKQCFCCCWSVQFSSVQFSLLSFKHVKTWRSEIHFPGPASCRIKKCNIIAKKTLYK